LRFNVSLAKSAVLLVDVDFRPSCTLHKAVHSQRAAESILKHKSMIVCPAFECIGDNYPQSITSLKILIEKGQAEGFHLSHFPQGHRPTNFNMFWKKSLQCIDGNTDGFWDEIYCIKYEELFEPYIVMASSDVPLYDERFQGYGLNKVSHLASVASQKSDGFAVLPGVFLVAPAHERSESWRNRYGTQSDETKFNQLLLKGLYHNFMKNLKNGKEPVVSARTRCQQCLLLSQEQASQQKEYVQAQTRAIAHPSKPVQCEA